VVDVLRANDAYLVELETDDSVPHEPHRSWGTYRVVERATARVCFATRNRDKSFGVFEYLAQGK
jgi:hypothetical protein